MRSLLLLALSVSLLLAAGTTEGLATPTPNVVCGGSCDGGGGAFFGGWCATPGTWSIIDRRVAYCTLGHTWVPG